jgi:hypothetical protein
MCAVSDSYVPSHFTSVEEISVRQKLDWILWLTELKSYTCVQFKFNQVYSNQIMLIYTCVMHWDVCKNTYYCEKVKNANELHDRIVRAAECITNEMVASITWMCVVPLRVPILILTEHIQNSVMFSV